MSGSESKVRLQVEGEERALEVTVLNSDFEQVALGVGGLDVELDPGLYEVQFRGGTSEESLLVKLVPGVPQSVPAPRLPIPSAAPVEGTSTSHEYHQHAAVEASEELNGQGESSGVVVMVRNVRGQDELPFEEDRVERLVLVDDAFEDVTGWADGWRMDATDKWAARVLSAPPGGYALSARTPSGPTIDQALWLCDGWQTLVFIPNTTAGPAPEHATIHMTRMGEDWSPWGDGSDIGLALEGVLWGLRAGRPIVPRDLNALLHAKFENPILGIVGAHALLLEPEPRVSLLDIVVGSLSSLVPGHPDVIALQYLADEAAGRPFRPHGDVTSPPLLLASYLGLIRIDAAQPGVLAEGSGAEEFAARIVVQGLWTSWETPGEPPAAADPRRRSYEAFESRDPALERLSAYVESAAEVRGVSRETILRSTTESLSIATGLPAHSVSRAAKELLA